MAGFRFLGGTFGYFSLQLRLKALLDLPSRMYNRHRRAFSPALKQMQVKLATFSHHCRG